MSIRTTFPVRNVKRCPSVLSRLIPLAFPRADPRTRSSAVRPAAATAGRLLDIRSMVTFCLLHGDWHDGACWEPLVGELRARGHEAVAPDMPYGDPDAGFEQRIEPALHALER